MPRGSGSRTVTFTWDLVAILYYSSRGFTLNGVQRAVRNKTGRGSLDAPLLLRTIEQLGQDGGYGGRPDIYDSVRQMWHLDGVDDRIKELMPDESQRDRILSFTEEVDEIIMDEPPSLRQQLRDNLRNLALGQRAERGVTMKLMPEHENVLYMSVGPGTVGYPPGARPHPVPIYPQPPPANSPPTIVPEDGYESPYPPPPGGWLGSGTRGSGSSGGGESNGGNSDRGRSPGT